MLRIRVKAINEIKLHTEEFVQPMQKYCGMTFPEFKIDPNTDEIWLINDDGVLLDLYYFYKEWLEVVYCEAVTHKDKVTVIGPPSALIKILEADGYQMVSENNLLFWKKNHCQSFTSDMLTLCGKEPNPVYAWNENWLKTEPQPTTYRVTNVIKFLRELPPVHLSRFSPLFPKLTPSVIRLQPTQFFAELMMRKQGLSHQEYLLAEDVYEIISVWPNEYEPEELYEAAREVLAAVRLAFTRGETLNEGYANSLFQGYTCAYCQMFGENCKNCTYGVRHGICGNQGSDYKTKIMPVVYLRARKAPGLCPTDVAKLHELKDWANKVEILR